MRHIIKNFIRISMLAALLISCDELLDNPVDGDIRSKIEGVWHVEEDSQLFLTTNYLVEISKHPWDSNKVYLDNIYNVNSSA